jgi:hypothetical protein
MLPMQSSHTRERRHGLTVHRVGRFLTNSEFARFVIAHAGSLHVLILKDP